MHDEVIARRSFQDGERVVSEGDASYYAYVVLTGRAKVFRMLNDRLIEVGGIEEGQLFGEASFLGASTRSATVVADGDLELGLIPSNLFTEAIAAVAEESQERLTRLSQDLTYFNDVYVRLSKCIEEIEGLRGSLLDPETFERDIARLPELPRRIATEMRGRLHVSVEACAELLRTLEAADNPQGSSQS